MSEHRKTRLVVLSPLLLLLCGAEAPPPTPLNDLQCNFRHTAIEVASLGQMPVGIKNLVLEKIHDRMAGRGTFFNLTDSVSEDAPFHRFIRGGHDGPVWFVWFEAGGIVYNKQLAIFLDDGAVPTRLLAHRYYFSERKQNPCEMTDQLLADFAAGRPPVRLKNEIW